MTDSTPPCRMLSVKVDTHDPFKVKHYLENMLYFSK